MCIDVKHIIQGCIDGDQLHQTALFNYLYPKLFKISYPYTYDEAFTKDIVQLGFIKIFNNIHKYSFNHSLDGWARKIIINTTLDELRRNKHIKNSINIENINLPIKENKYDETRLNIIHKAIETLPPGYKKVFTLYEIENYSHKEISQMLNICEGASKSNLFKAKAKLRNIIKNQLKEEYF